MAFTLTLLGTDTSFSPNKVENIYDRAETLSYISTLINSNSTGSLDEVIHFSNEHVVVINGPTTLGSEVGDRITRGVLAVLDAISRGETNISMIAHSRGAVEALLVAHELERIQTLLKTSTAHGPQIGNSVCPYTKAAMNGTHLAALERLNWAEIAAHIEHVKVSMLNIDPVPGGNYIAITRISSLAWKDSRFYQVPKIVKEYEQYIYENERSRCFKPVVPKCLSTDTQFKLSSLLGHHGTGSGNLLDQQRGANPTGKKTEHVQEFLIVRLIDFLTRNGVAIRPKECETDPFKELMAEIFADNGTLSSEKQLKQLYFKLYNEIAANKAAYQYYNGTSYPVLGQEQAIRRLIWKIVDQRIVHFQAHTDDFLETIIPPIPGGHFLNYEHARMHLNQELGLHDDLPLHETITIAVNRLLEIASHSSTLKELSREEQTVPTHPITDRIVPTLKSEEGFSLLLDSVGIIIEEVRQSYLQDKFIEKSEREAVYAAVLDTFKKFEIFTSEHTTNEVAQTIFTTFKSSLEATLTAKHKVLKERYLDLAKRMEPTNRLKDLSEKTHNVFEEITSKQSRDNVTEQGVIDYITDFARQVQAMNSAFPSTKEITSFLEEQYRILMSLPVEGELATTTQQLMGLLIIEASENNQLYKVKNIIREVITSYNELDKFRKALPEFQELDPSLSYEQRSIELDEQRARVLYLTAKFIAEHTIPFEVIEPLFGEENQALYNQISGLAIGLGAVNPLQLALDSQRGIIEELTTSKEEQTRIIEQLSASTAEQEETIRRLASDIDQQVQRIEHLKTTTEEQAALLLQWTSNADEQSRSIQSLTTDKEQQVLLISSLELAIKNHQQTIKELNTQQQEQESLLDASSRAHRQLLSEKIELEQQMQRLQTQVDDLRANAVKEYDKDIEFQCFAMAQDRLRPLTNHYLLHLAKEIKQKVKHTIDNGDLSKCITQIAAIDCWPLDRNVQILKQKWESVIVLHTILEAKNKPSEKVTQFYQQLNAAEHTLKVHRDSLWIRYINNALTVLAVIFTDLFSGSSANNTPKFGQSAGQTFFSTFY